MYRGQGDVIPGWVGGGVAARRLCLDAGGGEQVVALRSRSIMQTGGVSLSLPHPPRLVSLFSLPGLLFAPFHYRIFRVTLRRPGSADLSRTSLTLPFRLTAFLLTHLRSKASVQQAC